MISLCKFLRSVINVEDKLGKRLIRILPSLHNFSFFKNLYFSYPFCNISQFFTFPSYKFYSNRLAFFTLFFTLTLRITLRFLQSIVGIVGN